MTERNVHQQKKDLIQEINFLWHSPKLSDSERTRVLELLAQAREVLRLSLVSPN